MRTLLAAMLVISVWCGVALAKPKIAILGLEVIVSGTKVDAKDVGNARELTEALRRQAMTAQSKLALAPNSNRELLDEKLAASCDSEKPSCMAPIGAGLGADYLMYGRTEKGTEKGTAGYKVTLKLLDVKEKRVEETWEGFVPLGQIAGGSLHEWAQKVHAKLVGENPPVVPSPVETAPPKLVVNANVKIGDVFINQSKAGQLTDGTLTLTLLEGSHEIAIEASGYKRYKATVTLTRGQTKTTDAKLEPKPIASSLTLGKGKLLIAGSTVNMDISSYDDNPDAPTLVSFAPSVWYGLNDKITIGITHDFGATPWTPRPTFLTYFTIFDPIGGRPSVLGAGLCVTEGCPTSYKSTYYNSIGTDILYSFKQGSLSLVAHPGVDATVSYPFALDLRLGVLGRYTMNDRLSMVFDPRLRFGVIGRVSQRVFITSNDYGVTHDELDLPIWTWYNISGALSVYLHTGLGVQLANFGDLVIPLQLGGNYKIRRELTIGLDFGFRAVNDSLDSRALGVRVIYAP